MRSIPPTIRVPHRKRKPPAPLWRGLLLAALAGLLCSCAGGVRNSSRSFGTVIVDAGHGGHDAGTRASRLILEKDAALSVAQELNSRLRSAGFSTVMTRSNDVFIALDERVRISNRRSSAIFVSVHFNEARPRPGIHGVETYYTSPVSRELAQRILAKVGALPGQVPHGLRTARFRVLRNNLNPAVLVECGYMSNAAEAARCANPAYRAQIAGAIAQAIVEQRRGGSL